jgi:hypothetical protein
MIIKALKEIHSISEGFEKGKKIARGAEGFLDLLFSGEVIVLAF